MCYWSIKTIILFLGVVANVVCLSFDNVVNLQKDLMDSSASYIKPRLNQSDKVEVDILLGINSIKDYDEVYGKLYFTGTFAMYWKDETKTWRPSDYGGLNASYLPLTDTWTPNLLLRNGVDLMSLFRFSDELDIKKSTVTYFYNGRAKVITNGLYQVTCYPDVTYYPIDDHKCKVMVITNYLLNDVTLSSKHGVHIKSFLPNAEWSIRRVHATKSHLEIKISEDLATLQDQIEFSIAIQRQYIFPLVNVIMPILILSSAHLMVFLLPVESGERTSFSFTLFLALVVFLTMVSEKNPPTDTISVFNFFLLHQLISSVITTGLTVCSIRLFHKRRSEPVKGWMYGSLFRIYFITCKRICRRKDTAEINDSDTWQKLSMFFDKFCFWLLFVCFVSQLIIYGRIVGYRKTFLS